MKKIYSLAIALLSTVAFAQTNLVANGDFEAWDSPTFPTGFTPAPYTASVSQESTTVYAGTYSARHQTAATSSIKLQKEISGIVPGHSYTISYRFLDNDPNARARMWSYWVDGANATITEGNDNDALLRPNAYSEDAAGWMLYTLTVTAPANASVFRFEVRSYAQGPGNGVIYYDNFSVIDNSVAGVKENNIAGLKMFPNPLTGNILNISSDNNADKMVAVYDVLGKQVINAKVTNETLNVGALTSGVYIVKITEEGKTATRKLVIK